MTVGGILAGADEKEVAKISAIAENIGMAFQITDDVLDIMQTSEQIGKPAGNDIRQGIVTLPVIHALNVSPEAEELAAIVTDPEMDNEMVQRALAIVRATDGVEVAKAKADEYLERARQAIPAGLPAEIRDAFVQVADFIGDRDF